MTAIRIQNNRSNPFLCITSYLRSRIIKQWLEVKVEKEMEVARMHPAAVSFGAHPVPYAPTKVNINIFEIIEVD